ncbi:MAG: hypothetical protein EOO65_04720, partial [Methanosarcinales archaeon]
MQRSRNMTTQMFASRSCSAHASWRRALALLLTALALPAVRPVTATALEYTISTVAGVGLEGDSGDGGPATEAAISSPMGIAVHESTGRLWTACRLIHRVKLVKEGSMYTAAGNGTAGFSGDGGLAVHAQLNAPISVAVNAAATSLWIADTLNHRIRHVNLTTGIIVTVAGNGSNVTVHAAVADALLSSVVFPRTLALHEPTQRLYFVESPAHRVRYLDLLSSTLYTVLGNTTNGTWGDGGYAREAGAYAPLSVFVEPHVSGLPHLWIVDNVRTRIRRIDTQGIICTVVGDVGNGAVPCSDRWYP